MSCGVKFHGLFSLSPSACFGYQLMQPGAQQREIRKKSPLFLAGKKKRKRQWNKFLLANAFFFFYVKLAFVHNSPYQLVSICKPNKKFLNTSHSYGCQECVSNCRLSLKKNPAVAQNIRILQKKKAILIWWLKNEYKPIGSVHWMCAIECGIIPCVS